MLQVPGTLGYAQHVKRFLELSQKLNFDEINQLFVAHLPPRPACVLDAGSGAGQNAAALAQLGYDVVAVEPLSAFREAAQLRFAESGVHWLEGHLPALDCLHQEAYAHRRFDFILVDAVWHHLRPEERLQAFERIQDLLKPAGKCAFSWRNGPAGLGKHVFPIDVAENLEQAKACGLDVVFCLENQPSFLPHKEQVFWARVLVQKAATEQDENR